MSHRWSMSKAHAECLYPFRLDVPVTPRPLGKAGRVGNVVHVLAEAHVKGAEPDLAKHDPHDVAEAMTLFRGPFRGWLDGRKWEASELGLRYDAENDVTTIGPRRGEPGYGEVGPTVFPGTLDLVAIHDDALWIPDIKTGQKSGAHYEQVRAQAVAASRLYGITRAYVGFVFPRKTKCDEPTWEFLDADALDAEAGNIRRKLRMLPTAEPVVNDACVYCDARPACPAHAAPPIGAEDFDAMAAF